MNEEQAFLDAIMKHPEDALTRLAFSDWLEERGDPRGELLRLLHALTEQIKVPRRKEMETRLQRLLASGVQPVTPSLTNSINMELVLIPAGRFMMGSPEEERGRTDAEQLHEIEISRSFFLSKYAVTRGQFRYFTEQTGYRTEAEQERSGYGFNNQSGYFESGLYTWERPGFQQTDEHPVVLTSWNDAQQFCRWLSQQEGQDYRLPTEAEWEYGCRAGSSSTAFYHGDDPEGLAKVGNVADASAGKSFHNWNRGIAERDGYVYTVPVGRLQPNGFGLYDMHGNVWEWCHDWHAAHLEHIPQELQEPGDGGERAFRGGSWYNKQADCRCASSSYAETGDRHCYIGFRVARVAVSDDASSHR